jgi:3-mercaptopyruvate sulfurtransferase SseA
MKKNKIPELLSTISVALAPFAARIFWIVSAAAVVTVVVRDGRIPKYIQKTFDKTQKKEPKDPKDPKVLPSKIEEGNIKREKNDLS